MKTTGNPLNGMTVLGRHEGTAYVRLPEELQMPILMGCNCDFCKAHPHLTPKWDVLCVPMGVNPGRHTWTLHMPELADFLKVR